jgi:hydroxymethylpyrimidine pyrophosphatase-like HAD family hydrolase
MRFRALATDYDGTLADNGEVDQAILAALHRLRASGRKALIVTGRELPDLERVFPHLHLFDRVVAENGALLYNPGRRRQTLLCEPPPGKFLSCLRERRIPISVGQAIVATSEPYHAVVMEVIHQLGLELHMVFNKGSVMVLPSGTNKATGLRRALQELSISPEAVVGIGDAENDHAFLAACGCAVAVANALPALKDRAHLVTAAAHGAGVAEVIDQLLGNDLAAIGSRRVRS